MDTIVLLINLFVCLRCGYHPLLWYIPCCTCYSEGEVVYITDPEYSSDEDNAEGKLACP